MRFGSVFGDHFGAFSGPEGCFFSMEASLKVQGAVFMRFWSDLGAKREVKSAKVRRGRRQKRSSSRESLDSL